MRIGILSMQRILNYGSFFQAYSLKQIIESLGHEVVFVDFKVNWNISLIERYKNKRFRHLKMIKRMLLHPHDYKLIQKDPLYEYFQPCYTMLGMSSKYHFRTKVDVLVVGSDEVFNCLQQSDRVGYSLELFGKNNRARRLISYAASFGNTTIKRLEKYKVDKTVAHYLCRFDALSVRDCNSLEIIQHLCGKTPEQHLDPTLISDLEKQNWKGCKFEHFIIVYGYSHRFSVDEGNAIMYFAKREHLKVVVLNAKQVFGDEFVLCRPDEILGYFSKANYVVTDTFHGTIFSVLYHKPIAVFCRLDCQCDYSNENKLLDLLDRLGLKNQLVTDSHDLYQVLKNRIDYEWIDQIRAVEYEKAISYLRKEIATCP